MAERDDTKLATVDEPPAVPDELAPAPKATYLLAKKEEYIVRREQFMDVGENVVKLAEVQATPLLAAETTKRIGLWQEWGLRAVCGLGFGSFALFWPGDGTGRVLVGALAVCMITQGKPILDGVGSVLTALATKIKPK